MRSCPRQSGVDPGRAIGAFGAGVDLLDLLGQGFVFLRPPEWRGAPFCSLLGDRCPQAADRLWWNPNALQHANRVELCQGEGRFLVGLGLHSGEEGDVGRMDGNQVVKYPLAELGRWAGGSI